MLNTSNVGSYNLLFAWYPKVLVVFRSSSIFAALLSYEVPTWVDAIFFAFHLIIAMLLFWLLFKLRMKIYPREIWILFFWSDIDILLLLYNLVWYLWWLFAFYHLFCCLLHYFPCLATFYFLLSLIQFFMYPALFCLLFTRGLKWCMFFRHNSNRWKKARSLAFAKWRLFFDYPAVITFIENCILLITSYIGWCLFFFLIYCFLFDGIYENCLISLRACEIPREDLSKFNYIFLNYILIWINYFRFIFAMVFELFIFFYAQFGVLLIVLYSLLKVIYKTFFLIITYIFSVFSKILKGK